jgi:hypothetical protein
MTSAHRAIEKIERDRQTVVRCTRDLLRQTALVGVPSEDGAPVRAAIDRLVRRGVEADDAASDALRQLPADGSAQPVLSELGVARDAFAAARQAALRTVARAPLPASAAPVAGGAACPDGVRPLPQQAQVSGYRRVDLSELATEEALQREKLAGVLEVEADLNELRGMTRDLNGMLVEQRGGLRAAAGNIDRALALTQRGTQELRKARQLQ